MNIFKKIFFTTGLLGISICSFSQNINGIVNNYSEVISVDYCNNRAALMSSAPFNAGDLVLLIQMQGASIDQSASPTYGSVSNLNHCGDYELLTILSKTSNVVTFNEVMIHKYDLNAGIQLVKVPQYTNVTIDSLTSQPWNGVSGGIAIILATGTITLNGNINVTGLGFRGGDTLNSNACYGGGAGFTGYSCNLAGDCGAYKGESIFNTNGFDFARGAAANGGGGGNDHNTGGGGGANAGSGGVGGQRLNVALGGCSGQNPGIGGHGLLYSNANGKIFMGGGGGAGDMNNHLGTAGGGGGGIVILIGQTLDGAGHKIIANGKTLTNISQTDGAGGGGGGGTVLLNFNNYTSNFTVETKGGNGGRTNNGNNTTDCFGPGGGGGGGMLWVSNAVMPPQITYNSTPGAPGITINGNAPAACLNSNNGASAGTGGNSLLSLVIPVSITPYVPLTLTAGADTLICAGDHANLYSHAHGTMPLTYIWSSGTADSNAIVSPIKDKEYLITVTDSRGCSLTESVWVYVSSPDADITALPDSTITIGSFVFLLVDNPGFISYHWSPVATLNDSTASQVIASPVHTTVYCVNVTNGIGCINTQCITITVIPPKPHLFYPDAFTPNGDGRNDEFLPIANNACYHILEFRIYNRWGNVEYIRTNEYEGWNGFNKYGEQCETGMYVYYVKSECEDKIEEYKGSVLLIR